MSTESIKAVTLFYCYAREDEHLRNEIEKQLAPLKRQGYLTSWYNRLIEAGADWQQEIEHHLSVANLILVLLSPDFVHSDACDIEMRWAMKLHHTKQARVIPIILRPVLWEDTPLVALQYLPENGQPLTTWSNSDQAFRQVAYHLANIVREQLHLSPLQVQDWQAFLPPISYKPSFPSQQIINDPLFIPRNPYRGLYPFTAEHASDFFGQERLIAELLQTFQKAMSPSSQNDSAHLLSVVGSSGSGKSSVVLAGLIPALQRGELPGSEHWMYLEPMIPGPHPLEALARTLSYQFPQRSLTSLCEDLKKPRGLYLLLDTLTSGKTTTIFMYIDQFEETFTQTSEGDERIQFINLLLTALKEPRCPLALVISLRADFYDRLMDQAPDFFRLLQATQVSALPLDQRDLRDVIKKPAALPDVLLQFEDDLVGELLLEMRGQSGALPLLQFTLDRLFLARQGQVLTREAYHKMGGVQEALAQHAEAIYNSLATEESRTLTRALFFCLVEPGAVGQSPTRRRVTLSELVLHNRAQVQVLEKVATLFIDARLLTTTYQDGKALVEVSHEAIIRGWKRLADWLRDAHEDLYLQRRVREDTAAWIRQGRSPGRLYHADQLADALTWKQHSLLSQDEENFLQASQEYQVQKVRQQRRSARRAVLVSLAGLGITATALTMVGVLLERQREAKKLSYSYIGHKDVVNTVVWSPNGKLLASASDDTTVQVWDASTGSHLLTYHGHITPVTSVSWSPDSKRLASAGYDTTVQVWDASTGSHLLTYHGHTDQIWSVAWSPDGRRIASGSADTTVQVWEASTGSRLLTYHGHINQVWGVAWSPNGKYLASASYDKTVQVWDASDGNRLFIYHGHNNVVYCVAWSPDGQRIASGSADTTVQVWDANTGSHLFTYTGHTNTVCSVAWSPNDQWLASASTDTSVQVWLGSPS